MSRSSSCSDATSDSKIASDSKPAPTPIKATGAAAKASADAPPVWPTSCTSTGATTPSQPTKSAKAPGRGAQAQARAASAPSSLAAGPSSKVGVQDKGARDKSPSSALLAAYKAANTTASCSAAVGASCAPFPGTAQIATSVPTAASLPLTMSSCSSFGSHDHLPLLTSFGSLDLGSLDRGGMQGPTAWGPLRKLPGGLGAASEQLLHAGSSGLDAGLMGQEAAMAAAAAAAASIYAAASSDLPLHVPASAAAAAAAMHHSPEVVALLAAQQQLLALQAEAAAAGLLQQHQHQQFEWELNPLAFAQRLQHEQLHQQQQLQQQQLQLLVNAGLALPRF